MVVEKENWGGTLPVFLAPSETNCHSLKRVQNSSKLVKDTCVLDPYSVRV